MTYRSTIIADSVCHDNVRLTTYEVTYPSLFHAEMVSNKHLSLTAAGGNVHKPMTEVRAVATATEDRWNDFFTTYTDTHVSRPSLLRDLAHQMRAQSDAHKPARIGVSDWHMPYIVFNTVEDAVLLALEAAPQSLDLANLDDATTEVCRKLSVVRCFSASVLDPPLLATRANHEKRMAFYHELLALYQSLVQLCPLGTAFEHQAQPDWKEPIAADDPTLYWQHPQYHGNLRGWQQNRMMFVEPKLVNRFDIAREKETVNG